MKRNLMVSILMSVILVLMVTFTSPTYAKEAGLITSVSGEVFLGKDKNGKAVSFMKAKIGDVFYLGEKSGLQIVYFKNGRKEKWEGAVEITISEEGAVASASAKTPSVSESGSAALEGLRAIPNFIQEINTERTGAARVRALKEKTYRKYNELSEEEKGKVQEAKTIYNNMLKSSEPDDITPELFSIGVLSQFKLYRETMGLVKVALEKQPDNEGLKLVKESLEMILNKGEKEED